MESENIQWKKKSKKKEPLEWCQIVPMKATVKLQHSICHFHDFC